MPQNTPHPLSTVFLRHELPDGSAHVDWLIAPDGDPHRSDDRVLMTWRIGQEAADRLREAGAAATEFVAVRLPDHRFRYLDYEGAIGGDRGSVRREAVGGSVVFEASVSRFRALLAIGGVWRVTGSRVGPAPSPADAGPAPLGLWRFSARPAADDQEAG